MVVKFDKIWFLSTTAIILRKGGVIMSSGLGSTMEKLVDGVTKICAFALLFAYIFFALNANFHFFDNSAVNDIITYIMYYGPLIIVGLVCVEFAISKNLLIQIVIYALIAVMIIFQFFPDTWVSIMGNFSGGA